MVDQLGAHDTLRRAVDLGRHHGARHRRLEVQVLDGVGHPALGGEQEAGAHGDAGRAVGQGGHQAAPAEEAAGAEDQHAVAHGVDDLGEQERRGHGPGVPAALGPLGDDGVHPPFGHLLGVAPGTDRGHDEEPRLLAAGHEGRVGRLGEAGHPGAGLDHQLDALVHVGHVGAQVDAEGALRCGRAPRRWPRRARRASWWPRPGCRARRPRRWRRPGGGRPPSPCRSARAGKRTPTRSHSVGVQRRVAAASRRRPRSAPHLAVAQRARVQHDAHEVELLGRRAGGSRPTSSGTASSKPVAATMSSTVTPGWYERSRMVRSGVSKSNTPRLETTRRMSWKRVAPGAGRGRPGVADAADDVDLLDEGAHAVVGHPVAGGVVDRVARRAAHADELHLGLGRAARWPRCSGCPCGRSGSPSS